MTPKPSAKKNVLGTDGEGADTMKPKRLTIDISPTLHTKIKVACAQRGTVMADEIRAILEEHYAS